jgi:hypothetical protein
MRQDGEKVKDGGAEIGHLKYGAYIQLDSLDLEYLISSACEFKRQRPAALAPKPRLLRHALSAARERVSGDTHASRVKKRMAPVSSVGF